MRRSFRPWMEFGTPTELTLSGPGWTAIYDVTNGDLRTLRGDPDELGW